MVCNAWTKTSLFALSFDTIQLHTEQKVSTVFVYFRSHGYETLCIVRLTAINHCPYLRRIDKFEFSKACHVGGYFAPDSQWVDKFQNGSHRSLLALNHRYR